MYANDGRACNNRWDVFMVARDALLGKPWQLPVRSPCSTVGSLVVSTKGNMSNLVIHY
jgi:hypothetical protein